jgi:hypothetical protein
LNIYSFCVMSSTPCSTSLAMQFEGAQCLSLPAD